MLTVLLFILPLNSCSVTSEHEHESAGTSEASTREVTLEPEEYLVPESRYTTSGVELQKRYRSLMLDLIEDINGLKSHKVREKTVGFYYDQKKKDKDYLFLGYELTIYDSPAYNADSYTDRALNVIRHNLKPLLDRSRKIYPIINEKSIIGLVLGFNWNHNDSTESVTAWIDESDLKKYHNNNITFNECMVRSIYTGQDNKVIRLL
jgi:hypothetical protein